MADGKFPVILDRTPHKKERMEMRARFYARRGYVVVVQDTRGRFGSGSDWKPLIHEAKDGYDTIEWLAAQPWSTGKVGTIGASFDGMFQWYAASERPPPFDDHDSASLAVGAASELPLGGRPPADA